MDLEATAQRLLTWAFSDAAAAVASGQEAFPQDLRGDVQALVTAANSEHDDQRGPALSALFGSIVEPCNDRLDRPGRAAYAALFPAIVWQACSVDAQLRAACAQMGMESERACYQGYAQRRRRAWSPQALALPEPVRRVLVLSRVTIGADVLLTSLLCQRLHQAYPQAEVVVLGDGKLSGLFAGWPWLRIYPLRYQRRGGLSQRLHSWLAVCEVVTQEAPDVIFAPDSRLDQLGILPVIEDDQRYCLWENLQPTGPAQSLADLLDAWACQVLDLHTAPAVYPALAWDNASTAAHAHWRHCLTDRPACALKWDHGGNPDKALPQAAELEIMRHCLDQGWHLVLDRGFGDVERAASDALLAAGGWNCLDVDEQGTLGCLPEQVSAEMLAAHPVLRFHGSIAGWSALQAACGLAVSYDSVGHHLAAAAGVQLLSICTGHSHDAFPIAWQPRGPGSVTQVVIDTAQRHYPEQWQRVLAACPGPGL